MTAATDPAYRQMWQRPEIVQDMIDDWKATLDALSALDQVDKARVGYWGVSMGTMFGLPYVASDARVRTAVLGNAGMTRIKRPAERDRHIFQDICPEGYHPGVVRDAVG